MWADDFVSPDRGLNFETSRSISGDSFRRARPAGSVAPAVRQPSARPVWPWLRRRPDGGPCPTASREARHGTRRRAGEAPSVGEEAPAAETVSGGETAALAARRPSA